MIPIRSQRAHRISDLTMIEKGLDLAQGKHDSCRRNVRGVDLNKLVAALAWLFSNSCRLFTRSCWPLHQISDPYSATVVAAATTTLRIRLISKPPLLLLGLATRCRASLGAHVLEVRFEGQLRIRSEAKPLSRALFDRESLLPDANDCIFCSPEKRKAPAEHENLGLVDFELNFAVWPPSYSVSGDALKLSGAFSHLAALDHQSYVIYERDGLQHRLSVF
jgi:hypothetical protein